ncbi:MAG: LLM class flavin-dependent oxidoreductase [Acidimicrobiia bacterium]|nr:LLM class flavin-dependent oxidoreductase [Acidimicrobiia bacterium]MYL10397.1 LLM class flavin-dependent oxidoreductase [Acidimicrobiia bacterium]
MRGLYPQAMSASIAFGTGKVPEDLTTYGAWARQVESSGFSMVVAGDSQSLWADPFLTLSVAANHTENALLATTVTNPVTRHPAAAASTAMALQQISGGRFRYGIASGDSALLNIGEKPASVDYLRDYTAAVKALSNRETARWQGKDLHMRWGPAPVPVWIAAEGPRTQYMAGQIADGVILSNSLPADVCEIVLNNIAEGARSVGRDPDEVEVWWFANLLFAESEEDGLEQIKFLIAGTANHVYRFHMDGKGLPEDIKPRVAAMMAEYDSRHHAFADGANVNAGLADKHGLTEFLASRGTIAGPPEYCIDRLTELSERGINKMVLAQFMEDKDGWMRTFANVIAPVFC